MVTIAQVQTGVAKYVDDEFIAKLDGWKKWAVGFYVGLATSKSAQIFNSLKETPAINAFGLIDKDDNIDIDTIFEELRKQTLKGAVTIDIPIIGATTFRESDVDKLYADITAAR